MESPDHGEFRGKLGSTDWLGSEKSEAGDPGSGDGGPPLRFDLPDRLFGSTAPGAALAAARASIGGHVQHYLRCGL